MSPTAQGHEHEDEDEIWDEQMQLLLQKAEKRLLNAAISSQRTAEVAPAPKYG